MSKQLIYWVLLFLAPLSAQSQLFHTIIPNNPVLYGEEMAKYFVEANNLYRAGNFEGAIMAMDKAIAQDPFFAEAYLQRAIMKQRLGRPAGAEQDLMKAYRMNPVILDLYGIQGRLNRLKVMAPNPDLTEENLVRALYKQATGDTSVVLLNQIEQAIDRKLSGDVGGALMDIERVMEEVERPTAELLKVKGNLLLLAGEYRQAIEQYNQAISLDGNYAEAYFNRGLANIMVHNRRDGCADLAQGINLGYEQGQDARKYLCKF